MSVFEHLLQVAVRVGNRVVNDLAALLHRLDARIHEPSVRLEVQRSVTFQHFLVEVVVNIHRIFLYQSLAGGIIALRLDALDFREQFAEEFPESRIVINDEVGLTVTKLLLYHIVRQPFFIAPLGNELAVLHVRLGVFLPKFHT